MTALLLATVLLGDVTVAVETTVQSERPIAEIVLEGAWGYVMANRVGRGLDRRGDSVLENAGRAIFAILRDGPITVLSRVWRVVGFVLWDRSGVVEYVYEFDVGGIRVERRACIRNGRVETTVRLTGELGEPRLGELTLEVEANEHAADVDAGSKTTLVVRLSAVVRCRCIVAPIVSRIATRELERQLLDLVAKGRGAVKNGSVEGIVQRFVEKRANR